MASGDITDKYDERLSGSDGAKPVCSLTLDITIPDGTLSKEETIGENMLITGIYFWGPQLATAGKIAELILLDEDDNEIYTFGERDFSSSTAAYRKHSEHVLRNIMEDTTVKVKSDENVSGAKTFYVKLRGL